MAKASEAHIEQTGPGQFRLCGRLTFDSVPVLWRQGLGAFRDVDEVQVDLSGVEFSDSAGLALLVEWLRDTRAQGQPLVLRNMPRQMLAIAEVSGIESLLPQEASASL